MTKKKLKLGDTVQIISGSFKGKNGEVIKILRSKNQIIIKGINLRTKHKKAIQKNESGQIVLIEQPIHYSNVLFYDKEKKICSKIGYKLNENGKKVRFLKKTNQII